MTTETDVALPVRLYAMAMERAMSLAEFAQVVDATAKQMRSLFIDPAAPEHAALLQRLALLLREEPASLLANDTRPRATESFANWLIRQRQDMPIATLRSSARIGAGTLLRLRSGESLPDTDQAERLNQVLGTNREEFAHMVIADMVRREGYGTPRAATPEVPVGEPLVEPLVEPEQELVSSEAAPVQRQKKAGRANAKSTSKRSAKGSGKKASLKKSSITDRGESKTYDGTPADLSRPSDAVDSGVNKETEVTEHTSELAAIPDQTRAVEVVIPAATVVQPSLPQAEQEAAVVQPPLSKAEQAAQQPALALNEKQLPALTESEMRLIKNFRALHPQAQRAVEFYIGSLIVT